eukprot:s612_g39.t1
MPVISNPSLPYGRDSLSPSLRELCKVVSAVAKGIFFPDQTRSGRFVVPRDQGSGAGEEDSDGSYEMPFSDVGEPDIDTDVAGTDASSDASSDGGETIDDSTTLCCSLSCVLSW